MFKYHILPCTVFFAFLILLLCSSKIAFSIKNNSEINIGVTLNFLNYS